MNTPSHTTASSTTPVVEPRPWTKPTFEKVAMKEALTGNNGKLIDGPSATSS